MVGIKAHFDGKVIVPDEPLDLPRGQRVTVHVDIDAAASSEGIEPPKAHSALQWMADHAVDDPSLPTDGSYQHDHYLYGSPKKP